MAGKLRPLWDSFAYKPHQVTGIQWILQRETISNGGIVCDEMGLGKTIQMLGVLKQEKFTKTLLVAPVAVLSQWESIAAKSGIAVLQPHADRYRKEWKASTTVNPTAPKIYIIGYEMALNSPYLVMETQWTRIICDEAHRLVKVSSRLHQMTKKISAKNRWLLTATPIINKINDIQSLLKLVGANITKLPLKEVVSEHVMARSMNDLRASLSDAPPEPTHHSISLPFLTEEERDFYKGTSGIIVKRWKMLEDEMMGPGAALMKLKLFMRLRQLSLHPQVYIDARRKSGGSMDRENWQGTSTKFEAIKKLIVADPGHKWIVFCHFHSEMELLEQELIDLPQVGKVHIYNGALSPAARSAIIEETLQPSSIAEVLLIQLQSGGVGLNLQHFDRIIFSGPWWTSALMEQAVGRAVRIGQQRTVQVYHLSLIEEEALNIDRYMNEKAEQKGSTCREILRAAWPRTCAKKEAKEEGATSK